MKVYINENTAEVLSKIVYKNQREKYNFDKIKEVKTGICFDVEKGLTKRIEYFEYSFHGDKYIRFLVYESEAKEFENKIYNVFLDVAINQFIEKKVIEEAFDNKVMFSLRVNI